MKQAPIAVLLIVGSGCWPLGGHDSPDDDIPTDGVVIDTPQPPPMCDGSPLCAVCDPRQAPDRQGCGSGQRCVWEIVQESPERIGLLACAPDTGTDGLGEPCVAAGVGMNDSCVSGLVCVEGRCRDVCGFDGGALTSCERDFGCVRYDGLFANGDDEPLAGACIPLCEPLTQTLFGGGSCEPGQGCYLVTTDIDTIAVCAGAGAIQHGELISGPVLANSCVPGAQPRRRSSLTQEMECGGLCRPTDVTSSMNMEHEGGVAPFDCARWGAPDESCRYWYANEPFIGLSLFSNNVGWCLRHADILYDSNGDMTPDRPIPRCVELTMGDVVPPITNPPTNDALDYWCVSRPASFTRPLPAARLDRLHL